MSMFWSESEYSVWKLSSSIDYQMMLMSCVQKGAKYKERTHEYIPLKWNKWRGKIELKKEWEQGAWTDILGELGKKKGDLDH